MSKPFLRSLLFLVIMGFAMATESYMDYGGMSDDGEKTAAENIHELYRLLLQRSALENAAFGVPLEHLMIRKSQRSPSLRLRFGRSDPHLSSMGVLTRPMGAIAAGFDDNN